MIKLCPCSRSSGLSYSSPRPLGLYLYQPDPESGAWPHPEVERCCVVFETLGNARLWAEMGQTQGQTAWPQDTPRASAGIVMISSFWGAIMGLFIMIYDMVKNVKSHDFWGSQVALQRFKGM